jgi:hypothetical protein
MTCDTFDRGDGSLGPDYEEMAVPDRLMAPMSIVSGHVEWPADPTPSTATSSAMRITSVQPDDQSIEVTLAGIPLSMWVQPELYCRLNASGPMTSCVGAYMQLLKGDAGDDLRYANGFFNDEYGPSAYWDEVALDDAPGLVPTTITLRLEVDSGGAIRFYYNGSLFMSGSAGATPASPYVGFLLYRQPYPESAGLSTPHLVSVCAALGSGPRGLRWPPYRVRSARKLTVYYLTFRNASAVDTVWQLVLNDTTADLVIDEITVPAGTFDTKRVLAPPVPVLAGDSIFPTLVTPLAPDDSLADITYTVGFDMGISVPSSALFSGHVPGALRERRMADAALRRSRPEFLTHFERR